MSARSSAPSLSETLEKFRSTVNGDSRLTNILRGWEPVIMIEVPNAGWRRYLPVHECRIAEITSDFKDASHIVRLRSSEETLIAIFDGRYNPVEAFFNGELELFATDNDQVKLDAISLVLWGT
ncbi:MAG TPA: hypothetical protein VEG37_07400 [Burkholderiales bacterium]|nr:hypothetical protein [Burkholderiales bacterium]